jgi:hypothetical protein
VIESDSTQEEIALAGDSALSQAQMIFDAEFKTGKLNFTAGAGTEEMRKRFEFARDALTQAENVSKLNPGAVFTTSKGTEVFLSEAVDHLRTTIARAEEIYDR